MATLGDRPSTLPAREEWGIDPVPPERRVLGFLDQAVLAFLATLALHPRRSRA
jgi:hypothetical protein